LYSCTRETITPEKIVLKNDIAIYGFTNLTANAINYSICFNSVPNESRCSTNAICVCEGYTTAKFTLTFAGNSQTFSLSNEVINKTINLQNDTTINGIQVAITSMVPYPNTIA